MIDIATIVDFSVSFALVVTTLAFLITVVRVIMGPTLADRVVALDMLVAIAIGFIAVVAIKTGYHLYIDIAIALSLVGFLATIAFARLVLTRGLKVKGPKRKPARKAEATSAGENEV